MNFFCVDWFFLALGVGQLNLIGVQLEKKSQRFTLTHLGLLNPVGVFFTLHCLPVLESNFLASMTALFSQTC